MCLAVKPHMTDMKCYLNNILINFLAFHNSLTEKENTYKITVCSLHVSLSTF